MTPYSLSSDIRLRQLNGRPQLIINSPDALRQILTLSPVHWSANSAPIEGLSSNQKFLNYLDSDSNKRIMPSEVHQALEWVFEVLDDLHGCINGTDAIELNNFRTDTHRGTQLKDTAALVLQNLHKENHTTIHLNDVQKRTSILQVGATNGDGILPASVLTGDERMFVEDCLKIFEAPCDITGELGIDSHILASFNDTVHAWNDWTANNPQPVFTESMGDIIADLQSIIEAHFVWSKYPTVEADPSTQLTNEPTPSLLQTTWVHPNYRVQWKALWEKVLKPLSFIELSIDTWEDIWWMHQEHSTWKNKRPAGKFDKISPERLEEMVTQLEVQQNLLHKLAQDKAVSSQLQQLSDLEKTLLFQQNLCTFLNSFVNFSNFYNPQARSVPEVGSILLDGRWFRLVVHVPNREKHIDQAQNSGFFLLYLTVTLPDRKMDVAAAVTGSERGDLHIGKKAVFYSIDNVQYPAEVTHILDNPININEALLRPIEKLQSLGKKRLEKFSQEQESQLELGFTKETSNDKGQWMNSGVTLAALSSSFAYLLQTLTSVKVSSIITVILAPLVLLTLFSSFIAGWKLHRRDLGPILEASGWGINHPLRVPEWASQVFTLGTQVPQQNISPDEDLLMIFEHTAAPKNVLRRILMWLCIVTLGVSIWWQWEYLLLFIQNWEPPQPS